MKVNLKKLLSMGLVIASIAAVIGIAFSNSELEDAWQALGALQPVWVHFRVLVCLYVLRRLERMDLSETGRVQNQSGTRCECLPDRFLLQQCDAFQRRRTAYAG